MINTDLKKAYDRFYDRLQLLDFEIKEYKEIYKNQIAIAKQYDFWGRLQQMYMLNFIIKIYALCDKDKFKKDDNLSLGYFIKELEKINASSNEGIEELKKEIDSIITPWKNVRNKTIGHYDLKTIIENPLETKLFLSQLEKVVENIFLILHQFGEELKYPIRIRKENKSEVKIVLELIKSGVIYNKENG